MGEMMLNNNNDKSSEGNTLYIIDQFTLQIERYTFAVAQPNFILFGRLDGLAI